MRTLIQTTKDDDYGLVVMSEAGIDLLSSDETDQYIGKVLCNEIIRNCVLFIDRTHVTPTCVSVSGTIKSYVSKYIKYGNDTEGYGEMRNNGVAYDDDPYLYIHQDGVILQEGGVLAAVHVSSNCSVGGKREIVITGVADDGDN